PEAPVVDVPEPRPNDVVTPPSPPAPPAPPVDIQASVDISFKNMNPPRYPPAAFRAGIQGEVILIIDVDANGNVTNVSVEKSSRNRDLDRAAMEAARKWKFNPAQSGGAKAAGRVRVPVNFALS
ncbi:energy transducer TonB, partial [Stenotrophomonas pictorum]